MHPKNYIEAALVYEIAVLEAEISAWQPSWSVAPLLKSYVDAAANAAILSVWDSEIDRGRLAYQKALADHAYGQDKVQHLYL